MLEKMIQEDFGCTEDYNCAEKILYGANEAYDLKIEEESLKLSSAFGGGMGTGRTCGAVVAALMVIGRMNTKTVAHKTPEVRVKAIEFQNEMITSMGSVNCKNLKDQHYTETFGCRAVIEETARLLDALVKG